jgi:glutamate-ammonia-ligase adenylyltransferase
MHIPSTPHAGPIGDAKELIERALAWSRFAKRLIEREPALGEVLLRNLDRPFTVERMRALLVDAGDTTDLYRMLRRLRTQVMLHLLTRDMGGLAALDEVMTTTTALAEVTLSVAVKHLYNQMRVDHGTPIGKESGKPQELLVVGMGKLGGGELNVSSDIDLVFVYPEEGETSGPRALSNHEFFDRLGRKLIAAMSEITEDGYVFRVDMRLRPYGDSGPLTVSFAMLENYLITQGREWERYAWLKARTVCGGNGEELAGLTRPFVFRKYLDFGALNSLRNLHAQIRQEVQRRDIKNNIKLGPGGIREIEFIAQIFQLIRGGSDSSLRVRPTLAALDALARLQLLPEGVAGELRDAYVFLRNLEHRLQYLDDAQTQTLPQNARDQALIAAAMGFSRYPDMLQKLNAHRERVSLHFEHALAGPQNVTHDLLPLWQETLADEDGLQRLAGLGFREPTQILERLKSLRRSQRYRQMPAVNQLRLDALVPSLIEACAVYGDTALTRILQFVDSIVRRESYLALLAEHPQALQSLVRLCGASWWAAEYLTRHPLLLDELLDPRALYLEPDWPRLKLMLDEQLKDADTEQQMDLLRQFHHSQVFRLIVQDLAGVLSLERLSDHLSSLADLILEEVLRLCWGTLRNKHREAPRFAIVGYGKLGGKELGYASDLDLVFLHDDELPEAQEIYARLAQRINTWLTSHTAAGMLYDTDLRLRPDGASGLLVSSFAAFADYQEQRAWPWEHQALTRARHAAGDREIGGRFEALRKTLLCRKRDLAGLKCEVINMRKKMLGAHPNPGSLFDLKHDPGGIIDVEFIVQYLVLGYSHAHCELTANSGNLALLKLAGELGLLPAAHAEEVRIAYREFRRMQHAQRLNGEKYARVKAEKVKKLRNAVLQLWQQVFEETPRG